MNGVNTYLQSLPRRLFGIDLRALGVFRIAFGLALLIDLVIRAQDLSVFYTDEGIFPVADYHAYWAKPWFWSLHALSGSLGWELVLFLLAGIAGVCLIIGWRTRLFTLIAWVLIVSIQNRNPLVLQGADQLLRLIFFFALFVPWGRRYSLDSKKHPEWFEKEYVFSPGSAALLLQIAMVYIFSYLLKTGDEWKTEGTAIFYALSLDEFVKPLGKMLLGYPGLIQPMTFMVLRLEILIPILFFLPAFIMESRIIGVLLTIVLHAGLGLCLLLGPFPVFNIFAVIVFLPREFWDWLEQKFPALAHRPVVAEGAQPKPKSLWHWIHYAGQAVAAVMIVYLLWWNWGTVGDLKTNVPPAWQEPAYLTRTDQVWDLFGPYPMKDDGWYVIPGRRLDGKVVNVWKPDRRVTATKPEYVIDDYPNFRWQKYMRRLWSNDFAWNRPRLADYLCRQWNSSHSAQERLKGLDIYFIEEYTMPPGQKPVLSLHRLYSMKCK